MSDITNLSVVQYSKRTPWRTLANPAGSSCDKGASRHFTAASDTLDGKSSRPIFNLGSGLVTSTPAKSSSFAELLNSPLSSSPAPKKSRVRAASQQSASSSPHGASKRPRLQQSVLDFGQRQLASCSCGLTFNIGQPDDEDLHHRVHADFEKGIRFRCKVRDDEVVARSATGDLILMLNPEIRGKLKRLSDVLAVVNRDLGFITDEDIPPQDHKARCHLPVFFVPTTYPTTLVTDFSVPTLEPSHWLRSLGAHQKVGSLS
eukprot:m.642963 g.642963  ORF g.642963 m.642963 type:complete len:260 (+) comp58346_c0_seq39:1848-2627(+)